MALILFSSLVVADSTGGTTEKEIANCTGELEMLLESYNRLYDDFKEGINCGTAAITMNYMNEQLSEERDTCLEELERAKTYKIGFYIFFTILIIIAITIFFKAIRKKK